MPKARLLVTLIILHLVAAFGLLVWNGLHVPDALVGDFLLPWLLQRTAMQWITLWVPVTMVVFLLRYSLLPVFFHEHDLTSLPEPRTALGSVVLLVLLMTLIRLIALPGLVAGQESFQNTSILVRRGVEDAQTLARQGELYQAVTRIENVLNLAPGYPEGIAVREDIYNRISREETEKTQDPETPVPTLPLNRSFAEILERSRTALEQEDFFTALYYAETALTMKDMQEEPRARALREQARRGILRMELSGQERQDYQAFAQKRRALDAYEQGRYIEAYYLLAELEQQNPLDPDVQEWFPLVKAGLERMSFFIQDAQAALGGQVRGPVVWVDSESGLVISADSMARDALGFFFYDLEIIGFDSAVWYQAEAPYAKVVVDSPPEDSEAELGWYLLTRGIDREQPGVESSLDAQVTGEPDLEVAPQVLALANDPEVLWNLGAGAQGTPGIPTGALFGMIAQASRLGHGVQALIVEAGDRILRALVDLVVLMTLIITAWRGRVRVTGSRIIGSFVMLPPGALVMWALYQGTVWLVDVGAAILVQHGGLALVLAVIGPVLGLLFVVLLLRFSVLFHAKG